MYKTSVLPATRAVSNSLRAPAPPPTQVLVFASARSSPLSKFDLGGGFTSGQVRANGERLSRHQDSAFARFGGLYRMINATDFVEWTGTHQRLDSDPDFRFC